MYFTAHCTEPTSPSALQVKEGCLFCNLINLISHGEKCCNMKAQYIVGLVLLCCIATVNAATPLWLLFVNSSCEGERFESSSVLPAAEMAVERISSTPSLLPGYSLNLTVTRQDRSRPIALKYTYCKG